MTEMSMANSPLDRQVEQAVVALKKGAHVLRCGKRGKPKFCPLRLSSDETALIWFSGQEERSLNLNSVAKILDGQQTVNFLRHPQPGKEARSMSLIYQGGGESLDLICEDKEQAETWLLGLKAMVSRSHHLLSTGHASRMRPEKLTQVDNGEHQSTSARNHQSLRRIYTSEDSSYSPSISQSKSLKERSRERNSCKTPKTKVNAAVHEEEGSMDLFLWGEDYAILPRILKSTHSLNARKIFCGDQCAAVVNDHGGVFTWGKERGGRLGHKTNEDVSRPKLVDSLAGDNVESIAYGASCACALTRSGQVYAWGENYQGDGGNHRSPWLPRRLCLPSSAVSISEIACGDWHIAIVSSSGQLFTYGDGGFGVLGHGNRRSFSQPKEVEALRGMKVKSVACGLWHTAAVVELRGDLSDGKLFTWGDNDDGKLGHPWKEKTLVPTAVAALEDEGFLQVSCGMTLTVALTVKGKVFTMGSSVTKVEGALEGEYVKEISTGSFHVAVLTLKGEVYTWGKGANGRLGLGDTEDRDSPACVEALKDRAVQSIACGSNFTAAICLHKPVLSCEQFECSGCRSVFGLTRKKHGCHSCGQLFCRSCTRRNDLKKQSRVCDSCFKQLSSEGSELLERETASPRLTLLLKKGLFALKNDLRNQVEGRKNSAPSSLCPSRTRRWGQVDCPPFFSELQTNHETKRDEESKVRLPENQLGSKSLYFPSSRLKTEFKKPDRTLLDELEQLRKEINAGVEKAPAAGDIRSLGSILYDKISQTPGGVHGSKESQKDRLGCDSGHRLPVVDSSAGTKNGADRRQIGSSESIIKSTAAKQTEWVEEDEPGVYITFVMLPSGRKELKRVRFSRRRFSQKDAEKWWKENQMRVHLKYHTEEQTENTVSGKVDGRGLYKLY